MVCTGEDKPAEPAYTILVEGLPDLNPVYWSPSTTSINEPATDYSVYFALTDNTNTYNIKAAAAVNASVTDEKYASQPSDCTYANQTSTASSNRRLLDMNMGSPSDGLKLANGTNGNALTPSCGSCAPGVVDMDPAAYNASLSGLRVVNLTAVEQDAAMGTDAVAQLIPAGAVSQTPDMDTGANQCSYGETDRKAKRGGQWVATVADYPQPSLYVIDGATQTVHGFVPTAVSPSGLAWAPKRTGTSAPQGGAGR
ncbi:hypothetical protein WJX75_009728 [Coccomyxa subellipsoidea]|uniref:Uncharacterized protein n=1 Tax=Coccomyxa subellipsoidea TaxID=248742 RepID=A0ABR2YDF5_9CHLO